MIVDDWKFYEAILEGNTHVLDLMDANYVFQDREDVDLTALELATVRTDTSVVEYLLSRGAEITTLAIEYALFKDRVDIIEVFHLHGAMEDTGKWIEKCSSFAAPACLEFLTRLRK
jgi:hypothetical protein